jgi:hypothetical protein
LPFGITGIKLRPSPPGKNIGWGWSEECAKKNIWTKEGGNKKRLKINLLVGYSKERT